MASSSSPSPAKAMAPITALPNEILHNVILWVEPEDLGALLLVCRAMHHFVRDNRKLFLDVYMRILDEPPDGAELDYEAELRDLVKLQRICRRDRVRDKESHLPFVHDTVIRLLKHAASSAAPSPEFLELHLASKNANIFRALFKEKSNRAAFLQRSHLFERVNKSLRRKASAQDRQRSARLHCLYGKPILGDGRPGFARTYPYACSQVYDMRNYTGLTMWGPFMDDETQRVDWEKMEAVLVVLGFNLSSKRLVRFFSNIWQSPFYGSWPRSFVSPGKAEMSSLDARDPYGVTGLWHRIVCFLDYDDFFSFNFPSSNVMLSDAPRPPIYYEQAIRLIEMRIHVTRIEEPSNEDHSDYPVVHFAGISRPLDDTWDINASSDLRGTVRMTKEGEVRWTTYSIFHGHERWKSEGIQIGGIRSARGVVGHWFERGYDPHGPCGPSAFWKANDDETAPHVASRAEGVSSDFLLWGGLIDLDEIEVGGDAPNHADDEPSSVHMQ